MASLQYCATVLLLLIGIIGTTLQIMYLDSGTNAYVVPLSTATWLSVLTAVFAFDGIRLLGESPARYCCSCALLSGPCYYTLVALISVLLAAGYGLSSRYVSCGWAVLLLPLSISNVVAAKAKASRDRDSLAHDGSLDAQQREALLHSFANANGGREVALYPPPVPERRNDYRSECTVCGTLYTIASALLQLLSLLFLAMLVGGAVFEGTFYTMYTPSGTFYTIQYTDGRSQKVLAECVGPKNPGVATFWSEVGGGGHSMSDLWGLRDELVNVYGRRYCSYDPPGTGWSSNALSGDKQYITRKLMEEMMEEGPFIMLGSMDDANDRAIDFAVKYPQLVKAVVPTTLGLDEFQLWRAYHGKTDEEMIDYAKTTLKSRMTLGNAINFAPVAWGLMGVLVPVSPEYVPQEKAQESLFLNILNEKQWTTNCNALYGMINRPDEEFTARPFFEEQAQILAAQTSVPIFSFLMRKSTDQLYAICDDNGWTQESDECKTSVFNYEANYDYNLGITSLKPSANKLFLCDSECADTSNGFLINQETHIQWFANTLIQATKGM